MYQACINLLQPMKKKNSAILTPMLPGRKVQWLVTHVADMLDVICSDDFFTRTSWNFKP